MKKVLKSIMGNLMIISIISSCAVKSTVSIPPQQEFVLGEYQNSQFTAKVTNLSNRDITVVINDSESGSQMQSIELTAKATTTIYVSKNETVIFKKR